MAATKTLDQNIVQTKARAAAKTFLQAGIGVAGVALLAWITSAMGLISGGGDVRDIDLTPLIGIGATFLLAGIAALASVAMNWSKPQAAVVPTYDEG